MLVADAVAAEPRPHFIRSLALRFAETAIFLVAVIGAIALGLGITAYFAEHRYVLAYLVAYAGFRFSDLIVREDAEDSPPREELSRRIVAQLPLLLMFAAAPFERTYVYGGSAPVSVPARLDCYSSCSECGSRWARASSSDFSRRAERPEHPVLVKRGFYRYIRHPIYAGHIPGGVRMDAHLRRAGHGDSDADHRSDSRAAADEVRRSGDACAIRRRIRRLPARDRRVDSGYLVASAARALRAGSGSASSSRSPSRGSRTSRRILRICESIRPA